MVVVFVFQPVNAYSQYGIIFRDVVCAQPDKRQAERYGTNGGVILRRLSSDIPSDMAPTLAP